MPVVSNNNVSVVILTRNSASTIDRCLRSIIDEHPGEIIAVDSMSTDATLTILRRYGVKIVADLTCSLGQARQTGVISANRKYVMFVDSDVELTKDCISTLVSQLEENGWAAIQARLLSRETLSYWQNPNYWTNESFPYFHAGPQESIATAATLFRRHLILREQFDPNFVDAAEDVDVCLRLVRGGHVVGISPTVTVYHTYRREFLPFFRQQIRYGRGYSRLAHKYGTLRLVLRPTHYATNYLMKSIVTGKWNRIPYYVSVLAAIFIGIATFQPCKE
jgi:glycosyltransferase involved in cell wall biosynthesis